MSRPLCAAVAILAVGIAAPAALGYTEPLWESYTRVSPDGSHVFVMLHHRPGEPADELAAKYPASGVYRNDGSTAPVWVYAGDYARDAFPASDGVHVVLLRERVVQFDRRACGNSPPEPPHDPAVLAVYANGRPVRDIPLSELLDLTGYARECGPGYHPWMTAARVDDATNTLAVETVPGSRAVFDLASGRRVSAVGADGWDLTPAARSRVAVVVGLGLVGVTVLGAAAAAAVFLRSRAPRPVE